MEFMSLWILVVWLDRSRLRIEHILLCAIPYLVGAGLWYN